jgi:hypothetical protein
MNSVENYYKLQCARLDEQRKVLLKQLRQLEEEITNVPLTPQAQQQQSAQTMRSSAVSGKRRTKSKMMNDQGQDDQESEQPQQLTPYHGLATTPQQDIARKGLLSNYYDDPKTANIEMADQDSWQNVNQSVGNYMTNQVQQLMRKQGMV